MAGSLGKIPTTSMRRLISAFKRSSVRAFERVGAVQLLPVRLGKRHVRQNLILAAVHERCDLGVLLSQLISDQAPLPMAFGTAVLGEDRAQQRRHHSALTFADMSHGVAHEVHATALPSRIEYLGNSGLQAFVISMSVQI